MYAKGAHRLLRNIARHAAASWAEVSVQRLNGGLRLSVTDNGAGFDVAQARRRSSLGLASMRQRILLLNGKIDIHSSPGRGTKIVAWVAVRNDEDELSSRASA